MATRGMAEFRADGVDYTINDPNIAPEFNATSAYSKGDYVNYQGDLYRLTADHAANDTWGNTSKTKIKLGAELATEKANRKTADDTETTARENGDASVLSQIAPVFNASTVYTAGQYVTYNGALYKIIADHAAGYDWANTNKTAVTTESRIRDALLQIAPVYTAGTAYAAGTYVTYNGELYLLPNGAEDDEVWAGIAKTKTNTGSQITNLKSALFNSTLTVEYSPNNWENKNYASTTETNRLRKAFSNSGFRKYMKVIAPLGYKVSFSTEGARVWTGTSWEYSNLLWANELDIGMIPLYEGTSLQYIGLKKDDDGDISTTVGASVIFMTNANAEIESIKKNYTDVNYDELFASYANSILPDANNAKDNTIYVVQRTDATTTTHLPSDLAADGKVALMITIKTTYDGINYYKNQIIFKVQTKEIWRRAYASSTSSWNDWTKGTDKDFADCMFVSPKEIFDSYAQTFLTDLNNAEVNTAYIVQRTAYTTTSNFPSDFPNTGVLALLDTIKSIYDGAGHYQIVQRLVRLSTYETWYRVYNSAQGTWGNWSKAKSPNGTNIIKIGTGEQYTTLRDGIAAAVAVPNSIVYVMPGTYNLVTEFAAEITAHSGSTGIGLGNGVHIIFYDGAKVTALFDNSGSTYDETTWRWLYDNFQPFYAISGNSDFIIENLEIEASNTRYCVHDELNGSGTYIHKYINCRMKYTNNHSDINYVQCIGGGLGEHGTIVIDGGYYESETDYGITSVGGNAADSQQPISFHNGNNANADSSIIIKNVYLADRGYFRFGWYGTSAVKSPIQISGCGTGLPTLLKAEGTASVENFELKEFCNQKRVNYHWEVAQDGRTAALVSD